MSAVASPTVPDRGPGFFAKFSSGCGLCDRGIKIGEGVCRVGQLGVCHINCADPYIRVLEEHTDDGTEAA